MERNAGQVSVVRAGDRVRLADVRGNKALMSSDSAHVAFGTDEGQAQALVYDTTTGHRVELEPGAWSALPTQWLDDETVVLLVAAQENDHYRFDTCSIRTQRCTVAVPDLGSGPTTSGGNGLAYALPTGDYWFPYPHRWPRAPARRAAVRGPPKHKPSARSTTSSTWQNT